MNKNTSVHIEHCCNKHGCKYDDAECPVWGCSVIQAHPCEDCEYETADANVQRANRLHMALGNLLNSLSHDYHTDAIREAREAWERDK